MIINALLHVSVLMAQSSGRTLLSHAQNYCYIDYRSSFAVRMGVQLHIQLFKNHIWFNVRLKMFRDPVQMRWLGMWRVWVRERGV